MFPMSVTLWPNILLAGPAAPLFQSFWMACSFLYLSLFCSCGISNISFILSLCSPSTPFFETLPQHLLRISFSDLPSTWDSLLVTPRAPHVTDLTCHQTLSRFLPHFSASHSMHLIQPLLFIFETQLNWSFQFEYSSQIIQQSYRYLQHGYKRGQSLIAALPTLQMEHLSPPSWHSFSWFLDLESSLTVPSSLLTVFSLPSKLQAVCTHFQTSTQCRSFKSSP